MARIHWLYPAFGAYCREHHLTADQAIERLQEQYPSLPVALIVRAQGDTARIAELLAEDGAAAQQGQPQHSQQSSGNRQGAAQEPARDPQDFNAAIRARASARTTTLTLPHEAITGVKGQGEYDPAADIFRQELARYEARKRG